MDTLKTRPYKEGHQVDAIVEQVMPYGVFVRLEDDTRAYIRRRELSLDGDIDPATLFRKGQKVKAVVLRLAEPGRSMELSCRALLPDPWKGFATKFREGDVVSGTVRSLAPGGAFVQITTGISGFLPLEELASWKVERPEDVVWVGDHVEAVITRMDRAQRKVWLSVRAWQKRLGQAAEVIQSLHRKALAPQETEAYLEEPVCVVETTPREMTGLAGPVLVVEDDDALRDPLLKWLNAQGCPSQGFRTVAEALEYCQGREYGLILVDLDLPEVDGLYLVRQLRDCGRSVPVAVMSGPEWIQRHLAEIRALGVIEVFPKPLDLEKIRRLIQRLARGERPRPNLAEVEAGSENGRYLARVATTMRSGQSLSERLRQGLERLVEATRAEKGIVFHLDPFSERVSIVAQAGSVPLNEEALYSLVDSPVKDIIWEGGEIWEGQVSQGRTARFRKLLDLLPFESCIGVPIEASGRVEHALFLFHREPGSFSHYRLRDAWAMAALFAVALEGQALDMRIQDLGRIFLSGHLSAAFGHEVYNKISGLELQFRNLQADFERLERGVPQWQESFDSLEIRRALDRAVDTTLDLKQTVADFRRLMETGEERVTDVNQAVRQAEALVRPLARRAKVDIGLRLDPDLPFAAGNGIGLGQVFLNVMLNAVQHMGDKPDERRLLQVVTTYEPQNGSRPVRVRFSDTGPGIHRQLWEKIFALGFTTKAGGSGLGLYIARSLVESMGGCIFVEESLVPLGTTFLVELSAAQKE